MDNTAIYKTYDKQSWLDISNILYGSSAFAYQLAKENKSSITEDIKAGTLIKYSKEIQGNKLVLLSMASYKSTPATGANHTDNQMNQPEGIGYWAIGINFKVN